MTTEAREKINSHYLMRNTDEVNNGTKVDLARSEINSFEKEKKEKLKYRIKVHLVVFFISFIFTVGISVLSILLWVRPESFLFIIIIGLFSSLIFVLCFVGLRIFVLHKMNLNNNFIEDENLGMTHHLSKSVVYALVALVFAVVLAGFIVNIASANVFV